MACGHQAQTHRASVRLAVRRVELEALVITEKALVNGGLVHPGQNRSLTAIPLAPPTGPGYQATTRLLDSVQNTQKRDSKYKLNY